MVLFVQYMLQKRGPVAKATNKHQCSKEMGRKKIINIQGLAHVKKILKWYFDFSQNWLQCSVLLVALIWVLWKDIPAVSLPSNLPCDRVLVVQSLSHVRHTATPWTAAYQASLSFTVSQSLLKFMSIKSVMLSNHLILCHSLLFLPSVFPSIRVFSSESTLCLRWPKYWSFSFSINLSNEYSWLISFRIEWFDIFAVQVTLKSLPHHHNLKASIPGTWPSLWFSSHIHT